jgi:hypothetical protein
MSAVRNSALDVFLGEIRDELVFAQTVIRRHGNGFEFRHIADTGRSAESLRLLSVPALREWAQSSAQGNFRPLKSAPNLRPGWRTLVNTPAELDAALNNLYPGGIADWYAARSPFPPVTNYREFTNRQTGMYRITTMLSDRQAADVIRACCHPRFCLKRRLWTINGLEPDKPEQKSLLPCLEPCPVLLEFARKAMRLEQEERATSPASSSELQSITTALENAIAHPDPTLREADFQAAKNPRRLQLVLEKFRRALSVYPPSNSEKDTAGGE